VTEKSYDVVVIGGGLSGVSAAISAARLGSKVALVHDRPVLGGASSSESRVHIGGASARRWLPRIPNWYLHARETGIMEEFLMTNRYLNSGDVPAIRDMVLWDMVKTEDDIDLYLNTSARKAVMKDSETISAVEVWQTTTFKDLRLIGRIFIDASGDGHIACVAGAEYRMGRESRDEHGESMAPDKADTHTMAPTIYIEWRDVGRPVTYRPPRWAKTLSDADLLPNKATILGASGGDRFHHPRVNVTTEGRGWWWIEYGGMGDTIADAEEIHEELLKLAYGLWDHIKNHGDHGAANLDLAWVGAFPGKRESRRFLGDYILNQNDVASNTMFSDRVAYGARNIDVHTPGGIYAGYAPCDWTEIPPRGLYSVPLRSLYSKNIKNLMVAGRNISVTHVAMGGTREQPQCAIIGEAAGVAAHLCNRHSTIPRGIYEKHVGEMQQILLRQDCYVPFLKNEDPEDFAREAKVTASSEASLEVVMDPLDLNLFELDHPRAMMFLVTESKIDSIEVQIESRLEKDITLELGLKRVESLDDFDSDVEILKATAVVPGTGEPQPVNQQPPIASKRRSWIIFELGTEVEPGFHLIWLPKTPDVYWCGTVEGGDEPIGTRRLIMKDDTWRPIKEYGSYCYRLSPPSMPYGAQNVVSGTARPEGVETNIWVSEPGLPQYLELDLGKPQTVDTIYITFDTNLERRRSTTPAECVKDYSVYCDRNGSWERVVEATGNYLRRAQHSFDPVKTQKVRVVVSATNGVPEARVYEVRLYDESGR
jgi:hypothetical protein